MNTINNFPESHSISIHLECRRTPMYDFARNKTDKLVAGFISAGTTKAFPRCKITTKKIQNNKKSRQNPTAAI